MVTPQFSTCLVRDLGIRDYLSVWNEMQTFTADRDASTSDEIWLLQHESVFTQGQAGKAEHVLDAHDIPIVQSDRGGQVTYHGPGQLVIYFLLDVKRRKFGVRTLVDIIEQSVLELLSSFDISGQLIKGAPGVYVDDKKVAALGLRIRRGCSLHGLSLNIDMDLEPFSWINPCGYEGLETTQLTDLTELASGEALFNMARQRLLAALQSRLL